MTDFLSSQRFHPKDDFDLINGMLSDASAKIFPGNTPKHYVKGGWVRDKLRGVAPNDMDLFVPSLVAQEFINQLKNADRLRKVVTHQDLSMYQNITLVVQTNKRLLTLDITTRCHPHHDNCDFTCNNLILDSTGKIGTRLPPPKEQRNLGKESWLMKCITDAVQGKLVWMMPSKICARVSTFEVQMKMRERLTKMVTKGFIETGESLTRFQLTPFRTHKDLDAKHDATSCAICRNDYSEEPTKETLVLDCNHHFHMDCLLQWSKTPYGHNCPSCRRVLSIGAFPPSEEPISHPQEIIDDDE